MATKKTTKTSKTSTETDGDFELSTRTVKRKNLTTGRVEDHKITVAKRVKPKPTAFSAAGPKKAQPTRP